MPIYYSSDALNSPTINNLLDIATITVEALREASTDTTSRTTSKWQASQVDYLSVLSDEARSISQPRYTALDLATLVLFNTLLEGEDSSSPGATEDTFGINSTWANLTATFLKLNQYSSDSVDDEQLSAIITEMQLLAVISELRELIVFLFDQMTDLQKQLMECLAKR